MRRLLLWLAALLPALASCGEFAYAQYPVGPPAGYVVVSGCGTPPSTYTAGQIVAPTIDTTGKVCGSSTGSVTATGNITQWNGITVSLGAGNSTTGTLRVVIATDQSALSVTPAPLVVVPTDRSGTMAVGGTSQQLAAANASRKSLVIQNPCTTTEQGIATVENLYVSTGAATATQTNGNLANLEPCGSVTLDWNGHVDQTRVNVNAATSGHKFNATEYN